MVSTIRKTKPVPECKDRGGSIELKYEDDHTKAAHKVLK
jgi:hypothetical protein